MSVCVCVCVCKALSLLAAVHVSVVLLHVCNVIIADYFVPINSVQLSHIPFTFLGH